MNITLRLFEDRLLLPFLNFDYVRNSCGTQMSPSRLQHRFLSEVEIPTGPTLSPPNPQPPFRVEVPVLYGRLCVMKVKGRWKRSEQACES